MVSPVRIVSLGSLVLLLGCLGCQTAPSQPLGNILAPPSTIPPPGTNSYTFNDAPPSVPNNPIPPTTQPGSTSPFDPVNPSKGENGTAVRPYDPNLRAEAAPKAESSQWTASSEAPVEPAGSVAKIAARTGDEIAIPVSAFRTGTGMYSGETHASRSSGTGSVTQTTHVAPYPGNKEETDQVKSQPSPVYAEKVE